MGNGEGTAVGALVGDGLGPNEGNGLGLAIAEEIARAHHSRLTVRAGADGRGARITLIFPL